jgi:hypothetical protein
LSDATEPLLLTEGRETRSGGLIARVLNNEVRLSSVAIENSLAIRVGDRECKLDGTSLLTKEDAEGKVFSSLEGVLSRSVVSVGCFGAPGCGGIGVVSVPAALCLLAQVQEDNVIGVGQRESVSTSDLGKDLEILSVNWDSRGRVGVVLKTYVTAVVQDEVLRIFIVTRVVDLNGASIDVDAANLVGSTLPVWCSGCILGRLYPRNRVMFIVHAIAVEAILDTFVTASARNGRSSDGKNGSLESDLGCDHNGSGSSSGGGGAGGLADQHRAGARNNSDRVLLQDGRGRQGCRVGGDSSALVDASCSGASAEDSGSGKSGNRRGRSDGSNESAVAESCGAEGLKRGVLDILDSLVDSANSITLLGIEARVGSVGETV